MIEVQIVTAALGHLSHSHLQSLIHPFFHIESSGHMLPIVASEASTADLDTEWMHFPALVSYRSCQLVVLLMLPEVPLRHILFPWRREFNPNHCLELIRPYHRVRPARGGSYVRRECSIL